MSVGLPLERLTKRHLRDQFDCACPVLNEFLAKFARQHDAKGISVTEVLADGRLILGFVTYLPCDVLVDGQTFRAMKLARFGVDHRRQGEGVGRQLMVHVFEQARQAGLEHVLVDAKVCSGAPVFYSKFGFQRVLHTHEVEGCETMMMRTPR